MQKSTSTSPSCSSLSPQPSIPDPAPASLRLELTPTLDQAPFPPKTPTSTPNPELPPSDLAASHLPGRFWSTRRENEKKRECDFDWNEEEIFEKFKDKESNDKESNDKEAKDEESYVEEYTDEESEDELCFKCMTSVLQEGWIIRCEECYDPEHVRPPCSKCKYRNYCEVCREEDLLECRRDGGGEHRAEQYDCST
jgi:hypothetical protein